MADENALLVQGVSAGYGAANVLTDLSFSLPIGHSMAVLGRNGAGKTTLLRALLGLASVHKGEVFVFNQSVRGQSVAQRVALGLGWVPQDKGLFPSLTVAEHLQVVARPGPWNSERVYGLFPRLAERRAHYGRALSGGEQQMLAIGRALMTNPRLLLLDEPFEGLSPLMQRSLAQALSKLMSAQAKNTDIDSKIDSGSGASPKQAMSIVWVEQQRSAVLAHTDWALVLERGRARYFGPSATLQHMTELEQWLGVGP